MSTVPNSLVTNLVLVHLYNKVKAHDIEYKADAFWLNYLIGQFPQDENFAPVAQWGPDGGNARHASQKRCDMAILDFRYGDATATLLFFQTKRRGGNLEQVEDQVLESAKEYLDNHTDTYVYCMTGWETMARCWVVRQTKSRRRRRLAPMFGLDTKADRTYYYDANSAQAGYITRSILFMKGKSDEWPDDRAPNVLSMPQPE